MRNTGFRRKLFIASMVIIAVTQLLNTAMSISSFERVYRQTLLSDYRILARDLKHTIEMGLNAYKLFTNYVGIEEIFREALEKPGGAPDAVFTTNTDGKLLYLSWQETGEPFFKKYRSGDREYLSPETPQGFFDRSESVFRQGEDYIVSTSIVHRDAWKGNVSIIIPGKAITEKIGAVVRHNLLLQGICLAIAGGLLALGIAVFLKGGHAQGTDPAASGSDRSIRKRLLTLNITIILISQCLFSYLNLHSFQENYLEAIRNKTDHVAIRFREDVETLLHKGLALDKLVGIEAIMDNIVSETPEYSSLGIVDPDGKRLYFSDPGKKRETSFARIAVPAVETGREDPYRQRFEITGQGGSAGSGYISVSINKEIIHSHTRKIFFDYLTVVVVALLISFEATILIFSGSDFPSAESPDKSDNSAFPAHRIRILGFFIMLSYCLFIPFFPLFLKALSRPSFGLSKEIITGLPVSVLMIASSVGILIKGRLSERFGSRVTFLTGSLLFASGLFLTALSGNIHQVLGVQVILGVGFGINYLMPQGLVMDNLPPKKHRMALSNLFSGFYSGIICGSAMGGILAERLSHRVIFLIAGVVALATYLISHFCILPPTGRGAGGKASESRVRGKVAVLSLLRDRRFILPLMTQGIPYQIVYVGVLFFLLPLFLGSVGFSQSDIGRVIMVHGLVIIFGPVIIRFISRWMTPKSQLALAGFIISAALMSSFFLFGEGLREHMVVLIIPWIVTIAVCNSILGSGTVAIAMTSPAAERVGPAKSLGVYRLLERIGPIVAPVMCSWFIGLFSVLDTAMPHKGAMALIGVLFMAGTLVFTLFVKDEALKETPNR